MNLAGEVGQFKGELILYYKMMVLFPNYRAAETMFGELNESVFNAQINEMDIQDEKFFYGLRVNIVFSTHDNFHDNVSRDKTVFPFELLKDTASHLFR